MAIMPRWENPTKRLVITEFGETYNWNDFYTAVHEIHNMVASVEHQVDLIFSYASDLPPGNPLVHFRRAFEGQPVNTRQVIIVNASINPSLLAFMKTLSSVLQKMFPSKRQIMFTKSLDEACQILANKVT